MDLPDHYPEGALIGVLTTQPLDRVLDYRAPEGGCQLGAFVEVPLGPRKVLGVVWGPGQGGYDLAKVRQVIRVLDAAPMREERRARRPWQSSPAGQKRAATARHRCQATDPTRAD